MVEDREFDEASAGVALDMLFETIGAPPPARSWWAATAMPCTTTMEVGDSTSARPPS